MGEKFQTPPNLAILTCYFPVTGYYFQILSCYCRTYESRILMHSVPLP